MGPKRKSRKEINQQYRQKKIEQQGEVWLEKRRSAARESYHRRKQAMTNKEHRLNKRKHTQYVRQWRESKTERPGQQRKSTADKTRINQTRYRRLKYRYDTLERKYWCLHKRTRRVS